MPGRVEGDVEWPLRDKIAYYAEVFEPGPCAGTVEFLFTEKGTVAVGCTFDRGKGRRGEIKGKIGTGIFAIKQRVDMESVMLVMVVRIMMRLWWWVLVLIVPSRSGTRRWVAISWEGGWIACVFAERAGTMVC